MEWKRSSLQKLESLHELPIEHYSYKLSLPSTSTNYLKLFISLPYSKTFTSLIVSWMSTEHLASFLRPLSFYPYHHQQHKLIYSLSLQGDHLSSIHLCSHAELTPHVFQFKQASRLTFLPHPSVSHLPSLLSQEPNDAVNHWIPMIHFWC